MAEIKVVVTGAGGRMGAANVRAVVQTANLKLHAALRLHAALERPGAEAIGKDAGTLAGLPPLGVIVTDDVDAALAGADAIIDFTAPAASVALAERAAALGLVHVIGTTGCSEDDEKALHAAADRGARIVKSGNMSLGVNLLASLVRRAAAALGPEFDVEVLEMHHNRKVDAPSGTALLLGEAAAEGRGIALSEHAVKAREGHTGARTAGDIGFATLRGGTVVGEHSVILAGPSERIELKHVAEDRALFANGAVKAVLWAADKPKGYYSMADVLGL